MSVAEAGLRSLRSEFEAFNSKHGRIGVVLLCEVTFPLLDGSGMVAPSTGKWHLDSPTFRRPPEFPARNQRDAVTFASGSVRDGLIRLPPCREDSQPSSYPPDGVFATADGRLLIWTLTNQRKIPVIRIGRSVRYPLDGLRDWLRKSQGYHPRGGGSKT